MLKTIKELYLYREMLISLVRKDMRTRYRGSVLGFLWTYINPLMMLLVYTIVFSYVFKVEEKNYPMFLFVALLPWTFFQSSVMSCTTSITGGGGLIKKIYFPRIILPLSMVTSSLMNYIYGLIIVFAALVLSGIPLTLNIVYLPGIIFIEYMLIVAFGIFFSALNVYFRDLEHLLNVFFMGWFYLTPVLFKMEMVPKKLAFIIIINPVTPIIMSIRDVLYYGRPPEFGLMAYVLLETVVFLVIGARVFERLQRNFAEEV